MEEKKVPTKDAIALVVEFERKERFYLLKLLVEAPSRGLDQVQERLDMRIALIADWDWHKIKAQGLGDQDKEEITPVSLSPKIGVLLRQFTKDMLDEPRSQDIQEWLLGAYKKLDSFK